MKLKSIDYFNSSYIVDSLVFSEPYVYFRMDSVTNNFFEIFNISTEEDSVQQAELKAESKPSNPSDSLFYGYKSFDYHKRNS